MAKSVNREFEIRGVNHLALVCKDMARTVAFYRDILGMPLTKTIDLPGVSAPVSLPGQGSLASAHGSMNHIAFDVAPEKFDEYYERLKAKGVAVSAISNHDNSPRQISPTVTDDVFVRSVYFFDPDGALLEFAAWTRALGPQDVAHEAARADGSKTQNFVLNPDGTPAEPASRVVETAN